MRGGGVEEGIGRRLAAVSGDGDEGTASLVALTDLVECILRDISPGDGAEEPDHG